MNFQDKSQKESENPAIRNFSPYYIIIYGYL